MILFFRACVGMVDLEDSGARERLETERPTVIPGANEHDLLRSVSHRVFDHIVEVAMTGQYVADRPAFTRFLLSGPAPGANTASTGSGAVAPGESKRQVIMVNARVDHVVFWVEDPIRSVEFYETVLGFQGVRVEEFRQGKVSFPSVRISDECIIDLMPKTMAPFLNGMPGALGSAGNKTNHFCLAMARSDYSALLAKLEPLGAVAMTLTNSFGARGQAPEAFYFTDPDGNVLEARYYE